jgi:hypothetical protein
MLKAMKQQNIEWPVFEKSEMTDLIAWLNSRIIIRIAPVPLKSNPEPGR